MPSVFYSMELMLNTTKYTISRPTTNSLTNDSLQVLPAHFPLQHTGKAFLSLSTVLKGP